MRIKYNAPVTLTFTFVSLAVLLLNMTILPGLIREWFAVPGRGSFYAGSIRCWVTLFT
jgi:hypothetical protein